MSTIDFSIIIPHKDSLDCLPRVLNSIPISNRIEIIVIDNSSIPIKIEDIRTDRNITLRYSSPERFAGGARNEGLKVATGKWLLFADADDFFTPSAFNVFYEYINEDADLIYFKSDSVYDDTLEPSDRNVLFNGYIDKYLSGTSTELSTKLSFVVPWAKMIRRKLVEDNNIMFDEVVAANDVMFSTLVAYKSTRFKVDEREVYTITTRRGSLANRQDIVAITSRYHVALRRNRFLKTVGLNKSQGSIMVYLYKGLMFGTSVFFTFICEAISYRQNIFIGFRNWFRTAKQIKSNDKKNEQYITK